MKLKMTMLYVCACALFAQPAPPTPTELKAAIGITDAQVQQLITIRQQERDAIQPVQQQIAEKQEALRTLLNAGTTDAAAVGQVVLATHALRKQISDVHTRFQTQALQVLTADQKTKLKALEDAMKLQPAIQQAIGLGLLTPANPPEGAGPGRFGGGPGRMGGPGPRMIRGPAPL